MPPNMPVESYVDLVLGISMTESVLSWSQSLAPPGRWSQRRWSRRIQLYLLCWVVLPWVSRACVEFGGVFVVFGLYSIGMLRWVEVLGCGNCCDVLG
jgi:hypothetical protein